MLLATQPLSRLDTRNVNVAGWWRKRGIPIPSGQTSGWDRLWLHECPQGQLAPSEFDKSGGEKDFFANYFFCGSKE